MLKLFVCTALIYLPIALLCGILCFAAARGALRRTGRKMEGSIPNKGRDHCEKKHCCDRIGRSAAVCV